jgi:hypothetical protein
LKEEEEEKKGVFKEFSSFRLGDDCNREKLLDSIVHH